MTGIQCSFQTMMNSGLVDSWTLRANLTKPHQTPYAWAMLLMDSANGALGIPIYFIAYLEVCSICPGMNLANQTLFIDIACTLWALNIEQLSDNQGNRIVPSKKDCIDAGIVMCVIFLCRLSRVLNPRLQETSAICLQDHGSFQ